MRLIALVDGFNVYHSLVAAEVALDTINRTNAKSGRAAQSTAGLNFRWFNIPAALDSRLPLISTSARIVETVYFSAYATHAGADRVSRHKVYTQLLEGFGVRLRMSNFKQKEIECKKCGKSFHRHEEKETDVAIASALIESAHRDDVDGYLLFSGDTDQLPAIRMAKRVSPSKPLFVMFPFERKAKELAAEATTSWTIGIRDLDRWRWPKSVTLGDGTVVIRPVEYDG